MKVLLACGGSGGHINPALAMAQMLEKAYPDTVCSFAGRANSIEEDLIKKEGYPFHTIAIEGFHRKVSCRNFKSAFLMLSSPRHAKEIIKRTKAELVIGTGGFVSYPFLTAAHDLKVPSLLFEANATPGLCFKLCERKASRTLLQFEACLSHLSRPERARVIGAPLRKDFYSLTRKEARALLGIGDDVFFFLSFGGSLGAAEINKACLEASRRLQKHSGILHIHGCGKRYFEKIRALYPDLVQSGRAVPYIERMPLYMSAADLILCRAGAITLAELARLRRAAILVPSPNVSGDHQRKNAYAYQKAGAAIVMEEKELSAKGLCEKILSLKKDPKRIASLESAIKHFDIPKTPEQFISTVRALLNR